jgi:hypothetical protein
MQKALLLAAGCWLRGGRAGGSGVGAARVDTGLAKTSAGVSLAAHLHVLYLGGRRPVPIPGRLRVALQRKKQFYRDGARLRWARTSPFDDDGIFGSGKASCPAMTGSGGGSVREGRQTGATIISRQDELLTHPRTYIQYGR